MAEVIRFTAPLAEEDPKGTLIGIEAIAELEDEIDQVYQQSEELYEAAERLARAVENTKQGKRVTAALKRFREATGG